MGEITGRPTRFKGAGYEADVWLPDGRIVDGQSKLGRQFIEKTGRLIFGPMAHTIGRESEFDQNGNRIHPHPHDRTDDPQESQPTD